MEQKTKEGLVGIWLAAAAVFLAAFLPWGTIQATPTISIGGGAAGENMFGGITMSMNLTGWNGTVSLLGVTVPNWFAVVLALAAAGIVWLDASDTWHPPKTLPMCLGIAGLVQIASTLFILATSGQSTVGLGLLVAGAAFAAMVVACSRYAKRQPSPVA